MISILNLTKSELQDFLRCLESVRAKVRFGIGIGRVEKPGGFDRIR